MNAFYQRLWRFAELIDQTSQREKSNYADYFNVQHPPYPVVSSVRSVVPKLIFTENCPTETRLKIRYLLKKSFNRVRKDNNNL